MKEDIKLSKFDNQPWGFRLIGGQDFSTPLTVVKVSIGSLAEQAGMRAGDVLIAINGMPLHNLTHWEAHETIIHAGNNFVLSIVRNSPAPSQSVPAMQQPVPHQASVVSPAKQMFEHQRIQERSSMIQEIPKNLSVEEQFDILFKGQSRSTCTYQQPPCLNNQQLISPECQQMQNSITSVRESLQANIYEFVPNQVYSQQSITTEEARHNIDHYLHNEKNLQQMYPNQQWTQQNQFEILQKEKQWPQHQQQQTMQQMQEPKSQIVPNYHQELPPEELFTEDYIAEIMSGNAEVIMGKTMGVNFYKFKGEPKLDHLYSSGVLQLLQEEKAMKGAMK